MGWAAAVALAGVLVWGGLEHARLEQQAAVYAAAIAECANGRSFNIGDRVAACVVVDIVVY